MRILLDVEACTGHGRCDPLAPEAYDADDEGHRRVRIIGDVPADLQAGARSGAANCPERALTIEE